MRRILLASTGTVAGLAALIAVKANLLPAAPVDAAQPATVAQAPATADASGAKAIVGKSVKNPYESFQVKVTMTGDKVTKVDIVGFNGPEAETKQITSAAFPKLEKATIAANSAEIDTVSGATYTSGSYKESLQSALDQAKTAAKAAPSQQAATAAKTVTGKSVKNPYESFQVKVTAEGGKISKLEVVNFNGPEAMTKQITSAAFPKLEKAALAKGSADIDTVSGATFTSESYKESLQSALDQVGK